MCVLWLAINFDYMNYQPTNKRTQCGCSGWIVTFSKQMIWNNRNAYEIINIDWKSINHLFVHLNGSVTTDKSGNGILIGYYLPFWHNICYSFIYLISTTIHSQRFTMELPKGESFYDFWADFLYPSRTSTLCGVFFFCLTLCWYSS